MKNSRLIFAQGFDPFFKQCYGGEVFSGNMCYIVEDLGNLKFLILAQAGVSMLAQANTIPQMALTLLR